MIRERKTEGARECSAVMGSSAWFWNTEQRLELDRGRDSCEERRRTEHRKESCEEKMGN